MAVRTTADLVGGIVEVDEGDDLTPYIASASRLVDRCCLFGSDGVTALDYTTDDLEMIERWLAAHFYSVFNPRNSAETIGPSQQQFEGRTDLRLNFTRYGQQAMLLDIHGGLAALNNGLGKVEKKFPSVTGRKPRVTWLGKDD